MGVSTERMTQCGVGACSFQKASGSLGACFSLRSAGAQDSKGGSSTPRGSAEQ